MKKVQLFLGAFIVCIGVAIPSINAQKVPFEIYTKNMYTYDEANPSINDTNQYSGVQWLTTSKGSHYMWFAVANSSYQIKGQMLYKSMKVDAFVTNLAQNEYAILGARRENAGDPYTTVTGYWTA